MPSTRYSCHILMTIELSSQSFEKYSNIKYNDNTTVETELFHAGGRTDRHRQTDIQKDRHIDRQTDIQTDRYGEANSRFSQVGNAPKTPCFNIQNLWDVTPFFSSKSLPTLRRNVVPLSSSN